MDVHAAFKNWYDANHRKFFVGLILGYPMDTVTDERGTTTKMYLRREIDYDMNFHDIEVNLVSWLNCNENEINVPITWNGEFWDYLLMIDGISPSETPNGWVCEECLSHQENYGDKAKTYSTKEELFNEHLFEEFLNWVNTKLSLSSGIGVYGDADEITWAALTSRDDDQANLKGGWFLR